MQEVAFMHGRQFPFVVLASVLFLLEFHCPLGAAASAPDVTSSAAVEGPSEELFYSALREVGSLRHPGFALYVAAVEGKTLRKPVLTLEDGPGKLALIIVADTAELRVDASRMYLHLQNGKGSFADGSRVIFVSRTIELPLSRVTSGD
jgi:hypothetical protein